MLFVCWNKNSALKEKKVDHTNNLIQKETKNQASFTLSQSKTIKLGTSDSESADSRRPFSSPLCFIEWFPIWKGTGEYRIFSLHSMYNDRLWQVSSCSAASGAGTKWVPLYLHLKQLFRQLSENKWIHEIILFFEKRCQNSCYCIYQ